MIFFRCPICGDWVYINTDDPYEPVDPYSVIAICEKCQKRMGDE